QGAGRDHPEVVVWVDGPPVVDEEGAGCAVVAGEAGIRVGMELCGNELATVEVAHRPDRPVELEVGDVRVKGVDFGDPVGAALVAEHGDTERGKLDPARPRVTR